METLLQQTDNNTTSDALPHSAKRRKLVLVRVWGSQPAPNETNGKIAPQHLKMLEESGIPPEHAYARGYETIRDSSRLADLKIVKAARGCVPGLLVPMLRAEGSTWGYQYRPDSPRLRQGKPVKYETPYQQRNGLDVPPSVGELLGDPAVPLWITEGVKKADCGAQYGLCIVALTGVWNWKGTNERGGKAVIADFNEVVLNDRRVILAFDGDVSRKPSAAKALCALADFLKFRGASVEYLHLPDTKPKTGLDDFLNDGHTADDLWRLVKPNPPPIPDEDGVEAEAEVEAEPPPTPTDDPTLIDEIHDFLARYVIYPSEHAHVAHTLWIAHTHLMDCWQSTPRIHFKSPEPGSGKTRALEVSEHIVAQGLLAVDMTPAYLVRRIADPKNRPTLLYDEIDTVFGPRAKEHEDIRAVINSGHRKGAVSGRCEVHGRKVKVVELPSYSAIALAGLVVCHTNS